MTDTPSIAAALTWLRQGDAARAIRELEALTARAPSSAAAYNALGSVLAASGRIQPAYAALRKALGLRPGHPEAASNLGNLLLGDGEILEAQLAFESAIASGRAPVQAYSGLARALCMLGRQHAASQVLARFAPHAGAQPTFHSQRCYASLLDPELDAASVVAIHRDYEARVAGPLAATQRLPRTREPHAKLRLGYVSADLREHSVASCFEHVLAAHDRQRFQLHLYSDVSREDTTTQRMRGMADDYQRTLGISDADLAARVRHDEIDVLVDLAGHMQPNRLPVFARRPAPVQLTYLGYPGTTGMSAFDARISDEWADPDEPALGTEPVVRVPGGLFAYMPPADAPEVSPPPAASASSITFGCFNDTLKLNDHVLESWAEIVTRSHGSRLLLKAKLLSSSDVRAQLLEKFAACGVTRDRVELLPATSSRREHLQTYARVDLALDTFPYAGATTSCEALYMGVPVVTLCGDRHAGRLGVSILSAAGLADWIAPTREAYIARAVRAAHDPPGLGALRSSLRTRLRSSPLCDPMRVIRALEATACDLFGRWTSV